VGLRRQGRQENRFIFKTFALLASWRETGLREEALMTENEIAKIIVDVAYKMHVNLGPGLLESAYEAVMEYDLLKRGLVVGRQVDIPIMYDGVKIETAFRADLIVNDLVIIELKSVEQIQFQCAAHQKRHYKDRERTC
jgi:GxxExxY protein